MFSRILNLVRNRKLNAEIHEELEFHIDSRTKDNVTAGMTSDEARLDAVRRFGGALIAREKTRDANILIWLDTIRQDVLFACRNLRRNPGVTTVALISLAIGIGANTAIFSVVNAVMIRAFPYREADRIAILWGANWAPGRLLYTSFPNYEDWKSQNRVFEEMALYRASDGLVMNASGREGQPEWVEYAWVSDNFFHLLDKLPFMGRVFSAGEFARGERVALVSHRLWRRRFTGSPAAIGQVLNVSGIDFQVIGVMPDDVRFPEDTQLWVPASSYHQWSARRADRATRFGAVIGRLRQNTTFEQASTEMNGIVQRLAREYPHANKDTGVTIVPVQVQVNALLSKLVG